MEVFDDGKVRRIVQHRANLNLRQERFVVEYVKDGNGTRAAIRAGYATSSAAVHACRLLQNKTVLEKVRACQDRVRRSTEVTVEETLAKLKVIAYCDPGPLFDNNWNLLPPDKLPKDAYRGVDSIDIHFGKGGREVESVRVKLVDRNAALTTLAKCLGMFPKPRRAGRPGSFPFGGFSMPTLGK